MRACGRRACVRQARVRARRACVPGVNVCRCCFVAGATTSGGVAKVLMVPSVDTFSVSSPGRRAHPCGSTPSPYTGCSHLVCMQHPLRTPSYLPTFLPSYLPTSRGRLAQQLVLGIPTDGGEPQHGPCSGKRERARARASIRSVGRPFVRLFVRSLLCVRTNQCLEPMNQKHHVKP
jgi:hypothetical protein